MAIPDQPAAPPAILAEPASVPAVVEPQDHPKTDLASAGASAGPVPPPEPGHAPAAPATARARAAPPLPKQLEARPKDLAQSLPSPPPPSRSRAAQLTRGYAAYPRPNDEPEDPYAQPSYGWRPASPRAGYEPGYSSAPPYIGTYTTDGYGVRTFRFGP